MIADDDGGVCARMKRPAVGDDASGGEKSVDNKRFKETDDHRRQQRRWHDLCAWLENTAKLFNGSSETSRHELSGQCRCRYTVRVIVRDVAVPSPVYDMMLGNIRDAGLTVVKIDSVAARSRDHLCSVVVIEAEVNIW